MPTWLLKLMDVRINERHTSKETDRGGEVISEREMGAHSVRYNGVCKECNSGWMSKLENEAKPVFEKLIYQESGYLTPPESLILSIWLYKTSALYQLTGPQSRRKLITADDLHHFYKYSLAPGESAVHLCGIRINPATKIRMFMPRMRYGIPKGSQRESYLPLQKCFVAYLQIGDLLLSYTYRSPSGKWDVLRENDMPARQQIWPTSVPVKWLKSNASKAPIDPVSYFVEFIWK